MNLKYIIVGLLVSAVILGLFVSIYRNSLKSQKEAEKATEEFLDAEELLQKLQNK